MRDLPIGLHLGFREANVMLDRTRAADAAGLDMVWSTVGGPAPDPFVVFGRAADETTIGFGTSIVPTYPRHPIVMASQALALERLAPGRLRLGIGPSHRPVIEGMFGLGFERPLAHLREYLGILRALLHEGAVDVAGEQLTARARIGPPAPVPILIAALRPSRVPDRRRADRRRDLLDVAAALPARPGRARGRGGGGGRRAGAAAARGSCARGGVGGSGGGARRGRAAVRQLPAPAVLPAR